VGRAVVFASFSQTSNEARIEPLKRIVAIHRNDEPGDIISREMGAPLTMARAEQAHWRCHFEQAIKAIENLCLRLPIAGLSKVVTEHRPFPDNG
jgi:aldehyde dehydrogenase (NAD+)